MPRKYKGYAAETKVPVTQSKAEIERLVTEKYGASAYGSFKDGDRAVVMFSLDGRNIMFKMKVDSGAQMARTNWRALLLVIKAKLESVSSGIETLEEAFLSQVVAPDGQTYGSHIVPRIEEDYQNHNVPRLPNFGAG